MKFYADVHIAKEAVYQLRDKGVEIIHCQEVGLANADDLTHLEYAAEHNRIMVSCDDDFERYHASWQATGQYHAGIVYFNMNDQCKSVSIVVKEILFLNEAADYETDLENQIWRAQG